MKPSAVELNDLQKFPYHLKNRNNDLKNINVNINKIDKTGEGILISSQCGKYTCKALIESDEVLLNSPIKVTCSCHSFNFEFAHLLYDQHALLEPEKFKKAITYTPKEKNRHNVICGCKHIIAFCNFIYKNSNKINKLLSTR